MSLTKSCFVPGCCNSMTTEPDKLYFRVPLKEGRKKWFSAAGIIDTNKILWASLICCEDHFNVKEDVQYWLMYKIKKDAGIETDPPKLKPRVLPHIFDCQPSRKSTHTLQRRSALEKVDRWRILKDLLGRNYKPLASARKWSNTVVEQSSSVRGERDMEKDALPMICEESVIVKEEVCLVSEEGLLKMNDKESFDFAAAEMKIKKEFIPEESITSAAGVENCVSQDLGVQEIPFHSGFRTQSEEYNESQVTNEVMKIKEENNQENMMAEPDNYYQSARCMMKETKSDIFHGNRAESFIKPLSQSKTGGRIPTGDTQLTGETNQNQSFIVPLGEHLASTELVEFNDNRNFVKIRPKVQIVYTQSNSNDADVTQYVIDSRRNLGSLQTMTYRTFDKSCSKCPLVFSKMVHLDDHYMKEHSEASKTQPHVEMIPSTPQSSLNATFFSCFHCGCKFYSEHYFSLHMKECHKENKNQRKSILKPKKRNLVKPKFYDKIKFISCPYCPAKFMVEKFLLHHLKKAHSDVIKDSKRLPCPKCSRVFPYPDKLNRHLLLQQNCCEWHMCKVCPAEFSESYYLEVHMRLTHFSGTVFSCANCFVEFREKSQLKAHVLAHSSKRPYSCHDCPLHFRCLSKLYLHIKEECPKKWYSCQNCPAKFCRLSAFQTHLRTCLAEYYLHDCTRCTATFKHHKDLVIHLKIHANRKRKLTT